MTRLVDFEKKKIDTVQIRISIDEKADLKVMAELRGFKTVSDYIRYLFEEDVKRMGFER